MYGNESLYAGINHPYMQEIQRRLRRHRNYILVSETLEKRFVQVPAHELLITDETCAICWEKMNAAIRLPCRHIFHRYRLHSLYSLVLTIPIFIGYVLEGS